MSATPSWMQFVGDAGPTHDPERTPSRNRKRRPTEDPFGTGDAYEGPVREAPPAESSAPKLPGFAFAPMTSAAFALGDFRLEWLVRRVLVKGQPAVIGGSSKTLKTTIALDLAISLGTRGTFLGAFPLHNSHRVAVLSGESGAATLQESAARICKTKGVDLADANVLWQFTLPKLSLPHHVAELHRGLKENAVDVVVIDPLYLVLLGGTSDLNAANLYDTGPLLLNVAQSCLDAGATPILIHHARKNVAAGEPMELSDLAFSGIAEFSRQWLLINRREKYEGGSGHHALWLNVGGSAGHNGTFALDINEGNLDENFMGRKWDVRVSSLGDFGRWQSDRRRAEAEERDRSKLAAEDAKFLAALDKEADDVGVATMQAIRDRSGLSGAKVNTVAARLLDEQIITEASKSATLAKGAARPVRAFMRRQ